MREKRITQRNHIISYVREPLRSQLVADAATIPSDSIAYNDSFKALRLNNSANAGLFNVPIGFMQLGDKVEIEFEARNISGMPVRAWIVEYADSSFSSFVKTSEIIRGGNSGEFERLPFAYVAKNENHYRLHIGVNAPDAGDNYIRDIKVISRFGEERIGQSIRNYTLFSHSTRGFENVPSLSPDTCIVSVTSSEIIVTHGRPFTGDIGGSVIGDVSANFNTKQYSVKFKSESKTGFRVQIFDTTTGDIIDPTTVQNSGFFYIKAIHYGFDYL